MEELSCCFMDLLSSLKAAKTKLVLLVRLLDKVYVYFEEHKKQTRFCPVPN